MAADLALLGSLPAAAAALRRAVGELYSVSTSAAASRCLLWMQAGRGELGRPPARLAPRWFWTTALRVHLTPAAQVPARPTEDVLCLQGYLTALGGALRCELDAAAAANGSGRAALQPASEAAMELATQLAEAALPAALARMEGERAGSGHGALRRSLRGVCSSGRGPMGSAQPWRSGVPQAACGRRDSLSSTAARYRAAPQSPLPPPPPCWLQSCTALCATHARWATPCCAWRACCAWRPLGQAVSRSRRRKRQRKVWAARRGWRTRTACCCTLCEGPQRSNRAAALASPSRGGCPFFCNNVYTCVMHQ